MTESIRGWAGRKTDDAKRLRKLERYNQRLKRILADQALGIAMPKEVNWGDSQARLGVGLQ